jgi:hypothetical protein
MRAREERTAQGMKIAIVESGVNRLWVLERLRENVERSMQAKPVLDKEGQPTGEYRYEAAAANRALELIGKEIGMFVDRAELRIEDRLASMTKEQREEDARQLAARIRAQIERYKLIEGEVTEVEDE